MFLIIRKQQQQKNNQGPLANKHGNRAAKTEGTRAKIARSTGMTAEVKVLFLCLMKATFIK